MLVYKDIVSNDELFSDCFLIKEVDDFLYEVDCPMVKLSTDMDESFTGADRKELQNKVVLDHRLVETGFDKGSFKEWIMCYAKRIREHLTEKNPDRVPIFEQKAKAFAAKILENFDNYCFYLGEKMDPEAMVMLLTYRPDRKTPYLIFWKDGVEEEKF